MRFYTPIIFNFYKKMEKNFSHFAARADNYHKL